MASFLSLRLVRRRLPCLLAGALCSFSLCADQQAGQAASDIPAAKAQVDWQDWVDGSQVRATLAPPDSECNAALSKMGDVCEARFYAWRLAADGVTRLKLLDGTAFNEPPRVVVLGEGREPAALEWSLAGLRPGEGRQERALARHWPGADGSVLVEAQLMSCKPGIAVKLLKPSEAKNPLRAMRDRTVALQWTMAVLDADGNPKPVLIGGSAAAFKVGDGTVIRGLDLGVRGMAAGEVREVVVPPYLGYGEKAVGGDAIPANSTLRIRIEMREVN